MLHFVLIFLTLFIILQTTSSSPFTNSAPRNTSFKAFIVCVLIMCFLSAFRSSIVGNDTESYIYIFEQAEDYLLHGSRFEIGYVYLNYCLSHLTKNPQIALIVTSLFIYYSFGRFTWRHSAIPWVSVLLFFISNFGGTVNIVRQYVAMGILLWAVEFAVKRNLIYFLISLSIASLFHYSAFFFAPVYFLSFLSLNRKTIFYILGGGFVGYVFFGPILNYAFSYFTMYEYYSEGKYFEGEARVATYMQIFISTIISFFAYQAYNKNKDIEWRESEDGKYVKLMILFQFVALAIYLMCIKVNLLDRIATYYSVYSFINIANAISLSHLSRRKIYTFIAVFFFFVYTSIVITYRPEWNRVYPYLFCWQDSKNINYVYPKTFILSDKTRYKE